MNWGRIEGKWKRLRGDAREKSGELTDDDLDVIQGNGDHLSHAYTFTTSSRRAAWMMVSLAVMVLLSAGWSTARYKERPFFLEEQARETHGRKGWFDHLVEFDPGKTKFQVADDYAQNPPLRIAVLPFVDQGSANFVVNKIPLSRRDEQEQAQWAWTYANRLRRSLTGYLAQREFIVTNLIGIDSVLSEYGIDTWEKLKAVPPEQLGRWLGADAVVYGEVGHYEAYYALLMASWRVGVRIQMVSTEDGHDIFSAQGTRYSVDLRPSFTPIDIAINSALTLLQLRDVALARAEEEITREMVLRLPPAKHNQEILMAQANAHADQNSGQQMAQATQPLSPGQTTVTLDRVRSVSAPVSGEKNEGQAATVKPLQKNRLMRPARRSTGEVSCGKVWELFDQGKSEVATSQELHTTVEVVQDCKQEMAQVRGRQQG